MGIDELLERSRAGLRRLTPEQAQAAAARGRGDRRHAAGRPAPRVRASCPARWWSAETCSSGAPTRPRDTPTRRSTEPPRRPDRDVRRGLLVEPRRRERCRRSASPARPTWSAASWPGRPPASRSSPAPTDRRPVSRRGSPTTQKRPTSIRPWSVILSAGITESARKPSEWNGASSVHPSARAALAQRAAAGDDAVGRARRTSAPRPGSASSARTPRSCTATMPPPSSPSRRAARTMSSSSTPATTMLWASWATVEAIAPAAQAEAAHEPDADPAGAEVALDDGDLDQVAVGVGAGRRRRRRAAARRAPR